MTQKIQGWNREYIVIDYEQLNSCLNLSLHIMEACLQGLAIPPWFIFFSIILLPTILVAYAVYRLLSSGLCNRWDSGEKAPYFPLCFINYNVDQLKDKIQHKCLKYICGTECPTCIFSQKWIRCMMLMLFVWS